MFWIILCAQIQIDILILFLYTDGNPFSTVPHNVNGDAVTGSQRRCPYGYACVGRKNMFAVCCPIGHGK